MEDELIDLAEAAELLGVHSSTLRRWADTGRIPHVRTITGRRRFKREAILNVRNQMGPGTSPVESGQFEMKTISLTRQRNSSLPKNQAAWMARLNDDQRLLFRYSGQRLLGLMLQFISRDGSADAFLEEGRRVAGDYGRICFQAGLSVSQTAEAFLYP
jgi:excisionase family DNA binding protein